MSKIKNPLLNKLSKQGITASIFFVVCLILINSVIIFLYKQASKKFKAEEEIYEQLIKSKQGIITNLNVIDMSIRGYILVRNNAFLETYNSHKQIHVNHFNTLKQHLPGMGFDISHMNGVIKKVEEYYRLMDKIVQLDMAGETDEAMKIIKEDHGTSVWEKYVEFGKEFDPFINSKKEASQKSYDALVSASAFFNIILFIVGIPTLLFAGFRLRKNAKRRKLLYKELDKNNRELIFNSDQEIDLTDERGVVGSIINNLKRTASFIKEIAQGNYDIIWEDLTEENKELNKHNIAGELLLMRDQMKKRMEEAQRQNWVNEGLAKLSEILREHQDDFQRSADKTLTFIVNYLKAQQGGLFVLSEDMVTQEKYLELVSCYAFNRKKFINQKIKLGEGLVGQAYLEAEPIYMTEVPERYVTITSGLGESRPRCLLIFPLKHNDKVEAIIEIASFIKYDKFAMDFLESASKTIASSIASIRTNQQTKQLLEQSQLQAEAMKAQEEEMRQNMEELEATQEEMKRKEIELRKLLEKYNMNKKDIVEGGSNIQ